MHKVVCEMYLNNELVLIMMDEIQENLYKVNMDTNKVSKYDDREALDDFLNDYINASNIVISTEFFRSLIDYTLDCYDETDNEFYMKAYDCLVFRKVDGLVGR